ncbi:uncharacterized protein LOC121424240 [Lytechinus variegatus]|uniref:uncharacterized protein LOC121424240 n=1 Tax=Lytechinus variegatus TaxID=7654 RepID=UPI001BB1DA22|nr:uncharacterized protein LOC121424240 [Lytechinus variegatus]
MQGNSWSAADKSIQRKDIRHSTQLNHGDRSSANPINTEHLEDLIIKRQTIEIFKIYLFSGRSSEPSYQSQWPRLYSSSWHAPSSLPSSPTTNSTTTLLSSLRPRRGVWEGSSRSTRPVSNSVCNAGATDVLTKLSSVMELQMEIACKFFNKAADNQSTQQNEMTFGPS